MKSIFLICLLMFASSSMASSDKYSCDSIDRIKTKGKVTIDLTEKKIMLEDKNQSIKVFDKDTICAHSPSSGTTGINCLFTSQDSDNINIDISCNKTTETSPIEISHGSLWITPNGSGVMRCSVFGNFKIDLKLSNCEEL